MPRLLSLLRLPSLLHRRARRSRLASMLLLLSLLSALTLLTPLYLLYKPPPALIRHLQRRYPDVLWHVPTAAKTIALTIDDGPSEHTAELMAILKANNATATFFVIGAHVPGREAVLRDLVRAGHELANHAAHDAPSAALSDAALAGEIRAVDALLHAAYATVGVSEPPRYFRPGSGVFSARMRALLQTLGYRLVLGSIYPHDAQVRSWRVNAWHVLGMLRPGGIVVCHDGRAWTAPMLRRALPEMKRRGYRVVTVTELLREAAEGEAGG